MTTAIDIEGVRAHRTKSSRNTGHCNRNVSSYRSSPSITGSSEKCRTCTRGGGWKLGSRFDTTPPRKGPSGLLTLPLIECLQRPQVRAGVLALGLLLSLLNPRLLPSIEWGDWQLRNWGLCVLHVQPCCGCSEQGRSDGDVLYRMDVLFQANKWSQMLDVAGEPLDSRHIQSNPRELAGRVFHTC